MLKFSVCIAVYSGSDASHFRAAVLSIYQQSIVPDEIVVVQDGPVSPAVEGVLAELQSSISILRLVRLEENVGHAIARQKGMEAARNELIAIMDSDDIALPNRFELQLKAMKEHPEVSVVGGLIREFVDNPEVAVGTRLVPERDADIKEYMKARCPVNFVTVLMRKSHVKAVGGFIDWFCEEDYYLWVRLALAGYRFYNLQENLVNVRVGAEMYHRRGGLRYFKSETRLQTFMLRKGMISFPRYTYNVAIRFLVQVAMPNSLRGWVFKRFARSK